MKNLMRFASVTAALLVIGAAPARADGLPTPDELIDRAVTAMGGTAIDKIKSYEAVGEMIVPMGTVATTMMWAEPDHVLVRNIMPGLGEMTAGSNGRITWSSNPMMGYQLLKGQQAIDVREQAVHIRLLRLPRTLKKDYQVSEVAAIEFAGKPAYEVGLTGQGQRAGKKGAMIFDADTGRISAFREQGRDGSMSTAALDDWKTIDGVQFFHSVNVSGGPMEVQVRFSQIKINQVDQSAFAIPEEVQLLAGDDGSEKPAEEMKLEDFSPRMQEMINMMMKNLPWEDREELAEARDELAEQATGVPGEHGKAMQYVLARIDEKLAN